MNQAENSFIEILRKGNRYWNNWRAQNPDAHVDFSGVDFGQTPGIPSFSNFTIGNNVDFSNSSFGDDFRFFKTVFGDNVKFTGSSFGKNTDFTEAKFGREIDFRNTVFASESNFTNTHFLGPVYFSESKFNQKCTFSNCSFTFECDFSECIFDDEMVLSDSQFRGKTLFFNSTFGSGSSFANTVFKDDANISHTNFGSICNFINTQFDREADFTKTTFGDDVHFSESQFHAKSFFKYTTFSGSTRFDSAVFNNTADFSDAIFLNIPNFLNVENKNQINIVHATFKLRLGYFQWTDSTSTINHLQALRTIAETTNASNESRDLFILEKQAERGIYASSWIKHPRRMDILWKTLHSFVLIFFFWIFSNFGKSVIRPLFWLFVSNYGFYTLYKAIYPKVLFARHAEAIRDYTIANSVPFGKSINPAFDQAVQILFTETKESFIAGEMTTVELVNLPLIYQISTIVQGALSLLLLFLLGLAIRNFFRIN